MEDENPPAGLTRPPDDRDLTALARELNRLGARYIVIGGVAINRLGFIRATDDLDLLIARDMANQRLVRRALEILPDKAVKELAEDEDLSEWVVVRVNDTITVDLMTEATGIAYEEAERFVDWHEVDGVAVPFANAELMLRFKQGWRDKDALDRKFLEERKDGPHSAE
ncbi:hypothetical protein ESB00_08240 [Oleiharenicola lentus]|jgi:hypothetical protein|uniref:Nucleotidyltransferase family protein n=1 Tax=Oleiharenicola lentus TaxID=2508720 RepID=A0A4V1M6L9_9BACT|nr:hypothetical protein [Oleiharenicola lentus]RXK55859.1 hypothetical protein ESB00_08240 [Oleiharenicola lentus]